MDNAGVQPVLPDRVQHLLRGHHLIRVKLNLRDFLAFGHLGDGTGATDINKLFALGMKQAVMMFCVPLTLTSISF